MPSVPLTIPSRPSIISLGPMFSSSFEERRVSQPTIIPSSPSTPLIIHSSSGTGISASPSSISSSSMMMRRSSSAPQPRRGSSLPSIPSSSTTTYTHSTSQTDLTALTGTTTTTTNANDSSGGGSEGGFRMDILQFISSTVDPSWAEVEASPLSMVPSILPSSMTPDMDIDMVTFLREAPGVIRSPLSQISSTSTTMDEPLNFDDDQQIDFDPIFIFGVNDNHNNHQKEKSNLVTPELKQVSLRAFLEEDSSRFINNNNNSMYQSDNSPNPSLSIGEIYGQMPKQFVPDFIDSTNCSSSDLNHTTSHSRDKTHVTMKEFFEECPSQTQIQRTKSRSSTSSSLLNNPQHHKRISSYHSFLHKSSLSTKKDDSSNPGLGLNVSQQTKEQQQQSSNSNHSQGVGKVMRLAKEAFKIGNRS
ncbi:uncharacterized protein L201_002062 [Kwoniella dendrophila CBS 6074]|uniref:Uncharacterized protein n=1 Tax=Kwoniella dendrophila CBS 6074 TaxID=1295534 RepID=A0AAX4JP64_9TREE